MENNEEVVLQKPGFWAVCGAYAIDLIITQIVGGVVGFIAGLFLSFILGAIGFLTPDRIPLATLLGAGVGAVCGFIIFILYFALCESKWGCSAGKKICNIAVIKKQ